MNKVYYVSDVSEESALRKKVEGHLLGYSTMGLPVFEVEGFDIKVWKHFSIKPERKTKAWDYSNVPLPPFCVTPKGVKNEVIVITHITSEYVYVLNDRKSYQELYEKYDFMYTKTRNTICGINCL